MHTYDIYKQYMHPLSRLIYPHGSLSIIMYPYASAVHECPHTCIHLRPLRIRMAIIDTGVAEKEHMSSMQNAQMGKF